MGTVLRRARLRRPRRFEAENRFAFLHDVETIARKRFEISRVGLQQTHFASLPREQDFLLVPLALQSFDVVAALRKFFVRRHKQTYDHEPDREEEKNSQKPIEPLPESRVATRAEIAVCLFH